MAWPQWPQLPQLEFPPKELPVCLHPLRLIPYYKNRVGGALTSFLRRDDKRLFGPVEQAVTAVVILGLAFKSSTQPLTPPPPGNYDLPLPSVPTSNDTSPSAPSAPSLPSPLTAPTTGSSTIDLLLKLTHWLKDHVDMTAVLIVLLAVNVIIMIIPRETKSRLKTSWDLFWPPWQDRTPLLVTPSPPSRDSDSLAGAHAPEAPSTRGRSPSGPTPAKTTKTDPPEVSGKADMPSRPMPRDLATSSSAIGSPTRTKDREVSASDRRPTTTSREVATEPVVPAAPQVDTAALAKEIDRIKRKMSELKADDTIPDEEKARRLQEMEGKRQKLKAMMSKQQAADANTASTGPDPSVAKATVDNSPGVNDDQKQLEKLQAQIDAVQADSKLTDEEKAAKLKRYEKMRQQLKGKGKAEQAMPPPTAIDATPKTTSRAAVTDPTGFTSRSLSKELEAAARSVSTDRAQPPAEPSPEDRKKLGRLKGKMAAVKADPSLSDKAKAAMLAELDEKRQELKKKAGAAVLAGVVALASGSASGPAATPPDPAPASAPTSASAQNVDADQQRKQLEKLKGKMAAIKADTSLTESERAAKLRELEKMRQKLKLVPIPVSASSQAPAATPTATPAVDPAAAQLESTTPVTLVTTVPTSAPDPAPSAPTDALMIGETSQLKSALKKSTKKPRQKKNIHHNYFMTMRGWRPALVPFPHGLHPKPEHPRHTLWWDDIPKDADHIMASPKIAKVPEGLRAGEEEASGNAKKDDKVEEGKKVLEKVDAKIPPAGSGKDDKGGKSESKPSSSSAEKDAKEKAAAKAKLAEAEKLQAEAKAKEAAKAAKAKESEAKKPLPPSVQLPPPIDPQVQKATWITQGMLCALLFFIHEQLAFVVMGFFIWKHVQDSKARAAAVEAAAKAAADYKSALAAAAAAEAQRAKKPSADEAPQRTKVPSIVVDPPAPAATSGAVKPSSSGSSSRSRGVTAAAEPEAKVLADAAAAEASSSHTAIAASISDRSLKSDASPVNPSEGKARDPSSRSGSSAPRKAPPAERVSIPAETTATQSAHPEDKSEHTHQPPGSDTRDSHTPTSGSEIGGMSKTRPPDQKSASAETDKTRSMPPELVAKLAKMPPETRAKYEARYAQAQAEKREAEPSGGGEAERGEKRRDLSPKQHEEAGAPDRVATENDPEADRSDTRKGGKRGGESIKSQMEAKVPVSVQTAQNPDAAQPNRTTETEGVENTPPPRQEPREAISKPSSSLSVVAEPAPHPSRREVEVPASEPSIAEPTPLLSDEAARKASEKAKAARREERMRRSDSTRGKPPSDKSQKRSRDRDTRVEASAPVVEVRSVTITERSQSRSERSNSQSGREVERKKGTPTVQGLLVEVDDSLNTLLDPERTPRPGDKASKSDPPGHATEADSRSAMEKLKEERRARLLARTDKPAPLASAAPPPVDIVDVDLSPVSVYSQNSYVGGEKIDPPKSTRRLTRDVGAARDALADSDAGKKEAGRGRSSSVGSFGVIRFDGGKDDVPDPPRTAPILPSVIEDTAQAGKGKPKKRKSKETGTEGEKSVVASTAVKAQSTPSDRTRTESGDKPKIRAADVTAQEKRIEKGKGRDERSPDWKEKRHRPRTKEEEENRSSRKEPDGQARTVREKGNSEVKQPGRDTEEAEARRKRRAERENEKVKPRLRLEDLTPEQVEQMQEDREKRRVRKAREAKEARGEGSSGLTPEEKEELPTSP